MNRPKVQQSGPLSGWPYSADADDVALTDMLRDLRPWNRPAAVGDRLHQWARGDVDKLGCQDVAAELSRIGRQSNLDHWTDGAIAAVAKDMLHNVAQGHLAWELGGSLLVVSLPRSTRYRHRDEGRDYLYKRRRREADLRALVRLGRSPTAARAWLRRNPGKPVSLASSPRPRRSV